MADKVSWGILGTGGIAKAFARALADSSTSELVAVGSRSQESAEAFGDEFGVPRRYGSYAGVLADPGVQAVYISLPNHLHAEWGINCARAGKHILCEKPLTATYAEAQALVEAARAADVFLMEAFMYRCHPKTAKLVELINSGIIGDVRVIQVNFSFNFGDQPENIRAKRATAGGGIMDVGGYAMSLARLLAGAALGQDGPAEPVSLCGTGHIEPAYGVDTWAVAALKFPHDILATLTCGMQVNIWTPTVIFGSKGRIVVPNPWFPGEKPEEAQIEVYVDGTDQPEIISVPGPAGLYTIEADLVAKHLADRQAPSPAMTWADSLGNMKALNEWRHQVGVCFEGED